MTLLQRSITSSVYNIAANLVTLVTGLFGSIMLMRLLEPQLFGTFALAILSHAKQHEHRIATLLGGNTPVHAPHELSGVHPQADLQVRLIA